MIQVFLSILLVRIITVHILHAMNFYKLDRSLRYLLVIAHSDDESMFFGPFLTKILANKGNISIAVCTSGDKGGDKEVRSKEMERLCASHKVPLFMLEYPDSELAVTSKLLSSLEEIYRKTQSTALVTFDASGVSRHCDHITCCEIGDALAKKVNTEHLYNLVSLSRIEKYIFPFLAVFRLGCCPNTNILITSSITESIKNRKRMGYHTSQLLWYRYLYIIFSCYMEFIILRKKIHK
ncbi:N-acetylglucosaminylphosphatidylinositol deacetylase [Nematocida ausubeli]|nr:N-acetylglucosaminylphosphatidylinositol deacetylase [Nematocida ausubeli]